MRRTFGMILALALLGLCGMAWGEQAKPPAKKLIEWGWDSRDPISVRDNIREMEQRPFDGLVMQGLKVKKNGQEVVFDWACFGKDRFELEDFAATIQALKDTKFERFTDNFIRFNVCPGDVDWFDDFSATVHNAWVAAKVAKEGGLKGWMFDVEQYASAPFNYRGQKYDEQKTFEEYAEQVKLRGREFMQAINDAYPDITIMLTFSPDDWHIGTDNAAALEGDYYGLLPAFLDGMLGAATATTRFVDGNEPSYYYTRASDYFLAYQKIRGRAYTGASPENTAKYGSQVQVGVALYMDQMLALRKSPEAYASYYLTPEERLRFLESNVYYALSTAEEYVWCYSEMMNWWQNSFPEGTEAAVRSAQSKVRGNEPLGFDVAEMMDAATEKMNAAISARLVQRTAVLHSLAAGTSPPRIDGVLDDPLWQGLPPLEPFLPTAVSVRDQPECSTTAWVAYDRDMLYIAFRCAESEPANMKLVGKQKDDDVWVGDDVEVFVSASEDPYPYHQFIVNPANVQWDAECSQGQATNPDWSAQWESATHVGQNEWTAEIAIPWEALGGRPDSGSTRRANLCRNRAGALEVTTWCPVGRGFLEAEHFGVWKSAD